MIACLVITHFCSVVKQKANVCSFEFTQPLHGNRSFFIFFFDGCTCKGNLFRSFVEGRRAPSAHSFKDISPRHSSTVVFGSPCFTDLMCNHRELLALNLQTVELLVSLIKFLINFCEKFYSICSTQKTD